MANKYVLGFMIFVVLTASVYIVLPDSVKINIEKTKTIFKVWENEEWVLAGTERTILMDGTKKMRAKSRDINYFIEGNKTKIVRTANFKEGIIAIDTYYFDGNTDDIELYPVEHTVEIINGKGKLFVYEVNDLEYFGETIKGIKSPQIFGHQMKVEWQDGNYYSKIYRYKNKDIGKLTIKYRVYGNYEKYKVRLFDPIFYGEGNRLSYLNNDLKVNFKNAFSEELGSIELKSHKSVDEVLKFGYGKEEVVMYYDFKNWGEYKNGLGEVYFTDERTGKEIEKDYYFVEWVSEMIEVNDCKEVCSLSVNGTKECYQEVSGIHLEERFVWKKLLDKDIPNYNIRIGLKTYVGKDDYIDGVWTIAGKKVKKHVEWSAGLKTDLTAYYKLDETSGTNAEDSHSTNNGTATSDFIFNSSTTGKINAGADFSNGDFIINLTQELITKPFSVSLWANVKAGEGANCSGHCGLFGGGNSNIEFYVKGDEHINFDKKAVVSFMTSVNPVPVNSFFHVVISYSASGNASIYINGSLDSSVINDQTFTSSVQGIGAAYTTNFFGGTIDEVAIWNRVISPDEVITLYNSGAGYAYGLEPNAPTITLNSPVNNTNQTTNSVTFNCTASDDINLVNVSLILDGVVNETNSTDVVNGSFFYFTKNLAEGDTYWSCRGADNESGVTTAGARLISVDSILPLINITYPTNDSYTINVSDLNYIVIETNQDKCWYSKDGGATNSSTQTCMVNWTDVISVEGSNTWVIFANDTIGNENQTNVAFFKDTLTPLIAFESETEVNGSIKNNTFIYANVSVSELTEQNITFELYYQNGTLINSSTYTTPRREINWTGFSYGTYLYNVTIYDLYSRSNSTETRTIYLSDVFLFIDLNEIDLHIELNTTVNITGNSTIDFGLICIDIDHPDYGDNYTCSNKELTLNLTFDYFRITSFWNDLVDNLFNFTGGFQVDDENLTFTSHQYDEVDDLRFNISSSDDAENVVFYRCNTTTFDRAYQGFLVGKNIYLNQSVNAAGDTFRDYENLTFNNPGNKTIYFYLDDNATIQNITMNVTGKDYGFSYFDDFTNFSHIDVSETTAQLHYGPGGFIQSPNSSLILKTFDNFNDASIASHWTYSGTDSGSWGSAGVRETSGYLEGYGSVNNGYSASITKGFYPNAANLWYYTSDSLSFNLDSYSYELEDDANDNDCHESNRVLFGNVVVWQEQGAPGGRSASTNVADMEMEFTKINNSYWRLNISGTQVRTNDYQRTDCDDTGASVYTYDYSNGFYSVNYTDYDCTDTIVAISNSSLVEVDIATVIIEVYDGFVVDSSGNCFGSSYIRLDNLKNKMWNRTNGTVMSESIFDANSNIVSSTLNVSGYSGGNYSTFLWLSADNGVHWEPVTHGVEHTFLYPGKHIKWKIDLNTTTPGYHDATLYLVNVTVETPISAASNLEFDFGNDGIWDYKLNGTFNETNNTITISMPDADISSSFTKRRATTMGGISYDHAYQILLRIYSASAGQINLDIFNITYDPNPVILNYSSIQDFLDVYGSNETNFTIPIGAINGSVNVSDIKFDYAGGNDTIAITIRNFLNTINITRYITAYYSRWDYMFVPLYVNFLEFIPTTPTSLNVTPYGQMNTTAILNLTNYGYGDKDANLSVYLNETHSCVNLTLSTTWNKDDGYQLTSDWIELDSDINYLGTNEIYMWADFNCDYNTWDYFNPYLLFRQCCSNCSCSEEVS